MRLFSFSASVRTSLISRDKRQIFAFLWKLWTQEKYNFFLYTMGGVCSRTRRTTSDDIGGHTGEGVSRLQMVILTMSQGWFISLVDCPQKLGTPRHLLLLIISRCENRFHFQR